jgi:mono/diheme cytochrome c family protein
MPGFGGALTDGQIAALLKYLRAHFSDGPGWTELEGTVRLIRHSRERSWSR